MNNNMNDQWGSIGTGTTGSTGTGSTSAMGTTDHGVNFGTGQMGTGDTSWSTTSNVGTTPSTGLGSMLEKFGLGSVDMNVLKNKFNNIDMSGMKDSVRNVDMKQSVEKARTYANANPGKVLGGLAAVVIGAGLLRGRHARGY